MTMSQETSFLSELEDEDATIPEDKLAYFQERLRNKLHSYVVGKFLEMEKNGLTKAKLARRIGSDPGRITKLLGAPGNWTIDTISDLLIGICAEELVPNSKSILGGPPRNLREPEWLSVQSEGVEAAIAPRGTQDIGVRQPSSSGLEQSEFGRGNEGNARSTILAA